MERNIVYDMILESKNLVSAFVFYYSTLIHPLAMVRTANLALSSTSDSLGALTKPFVLLINATMHFNATMKHFLQEFKDFKSHLSISV